MRRSSEVETSFAILAWTRRAFAVMLLGLFLGTAWAQEDMTAGDLLKMCDGPYGDDNERLAFRAFCSGYVRGLHHMQQAVVGVRSVPPLFCGPGGATYGQSERIIVKWLKNNPERLHVRAKVVATRALMEAFPCQSSDSR
jgi:hypothetical protein